MLLFSHFDCYIRQTDRFYENVKKLSYMSVEVLRSHVNLTLQQLENQSDYDSNNNEPIFALQVIVWKFA